MTHTPIGDCTSDCRRFGCPNDELPENPCKVCEEKDVENCELHCNECQRELEGEEKDECTQCSFHNS